MKIQSVDIVLLIENIFAIKDIYRLRELLLRILMKFGTLYNETGGRDHANMAAGNSFHCNFIGRFFFRSCILC